MQQMYKCLRSYLPRVCHGYMAGQIFRYRTHTLVHRTLAGYGSEPAPDICKGMGIPITFTVFIYSVIYQTMYLCVRGYRNRLNCFLSIDSCRKVLDCDEIMVTPCTETKCSLN